MLQECTKCIDNIVYKMMIYIYIYIHMDRFFNIMIIFIIYKNNKKHSI